MRLGTNIIALIICLPIFGQLQIRGIQKRLDTQKAHSSQTKAVEPASLPFWDDFSIANDSPDSIRIWGTDTTNQWNYRLSKNVFINTTLAINPPSYGVATFDGLDENGAFHGDGVGLTDELVSDTINLQGKTDVVLSFYWQAGGNVELPEPGDSLVLQFYSPTIESNDGWKTVWKIDGADLSSDQDSVFTQETESVTSDFRTTKFVFRFQSYGDQDGPFDAWHLDWVYLNEDRGDDDFYYDGEVNINTDIQLLFSPYKSIPSNQFLSGNLKSSAATSAMSLNPPGSRDGIGPSVTNILTIRDMESSSILNDDNSLSNVDPQFFVNPDPLKVTSLSEITNSDLSLSGFSRRDSIVLDAQVRIRRANSTGSEIDFLDNSVVDLRINDSTSTKYIFHNYYAYDDGTAEYAAGTNINGAQVAVKYWLEVSDTLTHVDIYFPKIDPISDGSALELQIFKTLNEEPIRSQNINVINGEAINQFTRYQLNNPIVLTDTFYVGYQQSKNEYIGVGFDRSNIEASDYIYENRTGQWEKNGRLEGALMIRPVFESTDSLVTSVREVPNQLKAYPNPTEGLLKIDGKYHSISIVDFSGKEWVRNKASEIHDIGNLPAGLYLLTIHRKEGDETIKIIKK